MELRAETGKMSKKESESYKEFHRLVLVSRIMKDLNIGIIKARSIAESLIRRAEKVWNKEEIIMSEEAKHKFLYALIGAYGEIAEDFVKSIK